MQTITMYLRAASVKGTLVDEWNQAVSSLPALTRGMRAELVLKLVDANGGPLAGGAFASFGDHRIAMSVAIGATRAAGLGHTPRGTSPWRTTGTRRPRHSSA